MFRSYYNCLRNYLSEGEYDWQQSLEVKPFLIESCQLFSDDNNESENICREYSQLQYECWMKFRELVEKVLNSVLKKMGGSMEMLEKALDIYISEPPEGPRDDFNKELLLNLTTVHNFRRFAKMMNSIYNNSNVIEKIEVPIESEWVEYIDEASGSPYYWNSKTNESSWIPPAGFSPNRDDNNNNNYSKETKGEGGGLEDHYESLMGMGYPVDIANKILDKFSRSGNNNVTLDEFVKAADVLISSSEPSKEAKTGQLTLEDHYETLVNMGYPVEVVNMVLDEISSSKRSTPVTLDELIKSVDSAISMSVSMRSRGTPAYLQELAVILEKENYQVNNESANKALITLELRSKFSSAANLLKSLGGDGAEGDAGVRKLIKWAGEMVDLEKDIKETFDSGISLNERGLLQRFYSLEKVRTLLENNGSSVKLKIQEAEENFTGSDAEKAIRDLFRRADELEHDLDRMRQKLLLFIATEKNCGREAVEELYLYIKEKIGSGIELETIMEEMHNHVYNLVSSSKADQLLSLLIDMSLIEDEQEMTQRSIMEAMTGETQVEVEVEVETAEEVKEEIKEEVIEETIETMIEKVKSKHKMCLSTLKRIVDTERDHRLQELEVQLVRKKKLKENPDHSDSSNQSILDKDIKSLESSIETVNNHYNHINEGLSNGFKKKCLNEVSLLKKKGSVLTSDDILKSTRDTADNIKKRFHRDQTSLLESLEEDRGRHRTKIFKSFDKDNNNDNNNNTFTSDQLDQLERMNKSCNSQESLTFSYANENILLALSSINIDSTLLDDNMNALRNNLNASEDDQDDDYFDSDDNNHKNNPTDWLSRVGKVREVYSTAGKCLQRELRRMFQTVWTEVDIFKCTDPKIDSTMFTVYTEAVADMMKVLMESFDNQISEFSNQNKQKIHESKTMQFESDRFKMKLVINDQYDKSSEIKTILENIPSEISENEEVSAKMKNLQKLFKLVIQQFLGDPAFFKEYEKMPDKEISKSNENQSMRKSSSAPDVKKEDKEAEEEEVHMVRSNSELDLSVGLTGLSPLKATQPNSSFSISSSAYQQTIAQQNLLQKEALSSEVSKISSAYNEEKQKLELKMKIEQARQKQALQRKLFEKKKKANGNSSEETNS